MPIGGTSQTTVWHHGVRLCAAGMLLSAMALWAPAHAGTTTYEYDALGRLKTTSDSKSGSKSSFEYDKAGNRTSDSAIAGVAKPTLTALAFGSRQIGVPVSLDATLKNPSTTPVTVTLPPSVVGTAFRYKATNCAATLAAGASCAISVEFTPSNAVLYTGELSVSAGGEAIKVPLSGSGAEPAASLSEVAFGERVINTDTDLTALLTNPGSTALALTKPDATAVSGTDYSFLTTTCGTSLAANSSCSITVRFRPTVVGTRTGSVNVTTAGGAVRGALTGVGKSAPGVLSLVTPGDPVVLGTTLTPNAASGRDVWFTNTGPGPIKIAGAPVLTGADLGYWVGSPNNCSAGRVLAKDETCSVYVFSSSSAGTYGGTLSLASDGGTITRNVTLTMKGGLRGDADFGSVVVGQTSTRTVSVTNTAAFPVRGLSVTATAPYTVVSDGCTGVTLAKDASCSLSVQFAPTTTGTFNGSGLLKVRGTYNQVWVLADGVTHQESAQAGSAVDYAMTVTGVGKTGTPVLTLENVGSPVSLGANLTPVAASGRDIYYKNTGDGPLTINGVPSVSGAALGSWVGSPWNCASGRVLQPGEHCSVYVYSQGGEGTFPGTVTINSSGGNLTTNVSGHYRGRVEATGGSFGTVLVGQTSTQTVTLVNQASYPIYGLTPTATAPYSVTTNGCAATLAAGASCNVTVTFTPTAAGSASGTGFMKVSAYYKQVFVDLPGNQVEGSQAGTTLDYPVSLSGTGALPTPVLTQDTAGNPVSLGTTLTPVAASGRDVYFKNTGNGELKITSSPVTVGGGLSQWIGSPWNCAAGKVLQPGERCSVYVFSQSGEGTYPGSVTVYSNGGNVTVNVSGSYVGRVSQTGGGAFGNVLVGQSASQTVTVLNQASYAFYGVTPTASAPFSLVSNNCPAALPAGSSCTVTIAFAPSSAGTVTGTGYLKVAGYYRQVWVDGSGAQVEGTQAGSNLEYAIALSGTGVQPTPVLSLMNGSNPVSLGQNLTPVAASGGSVFYKNTGTGPLTISATPTVAGAGLSAWTGSPWNCVGGKVLQPGEYCSVYVFSQSGEGTFPGSVSITSTGGALTTGVVGTYSGRVGWVSGGSFGTVAVGQSSSQTVTVSNQASYAVYGLAPSATGPYSVVSNNCPATLGPGVSCNMTIKFSPAAAGSASGANYLSMSGYYKQVLTDINGSQVEGGQAGSAINFPIALSGTGI